LHIEFPKACFATLHLSLILISIGTITAEIFAPHQTVREWFLNIVFVSLFYLFYIITNDIVNIALLQSFLYHELMTIHKDVH
jgi:hypothetical protein